MAVVTAALLVVLAACSTVRPPAAPEPAPDEVRTLWHGGRLREYRVHVPSSARDGKPHPLVVLFHGSGTTAGAFQRETGFDGNRVLDLGIWVIIAALVGAKGLLFIVDFDHFTSSREEFFSLLRSGGVFYGGLIAAALVCIYQLRKHKLPLWRSGDLFAPGIALGYMVGRLGCLAAGCCYGKPTQVAWAVTFNDPAAALNVGTPLGVPLHPTQLYESLAGLVILLVLLATERRGKPFAGRTFWHFAFMYAVSRFVIEFFRGDDRGMVSMFSTSQTISLVLAPLSIVMLWWLAGHASSITATVARKRGSF